MACCILDPCAFAAPWMSLRAFTAVHEWASANAHAMDDMSYSSSGTGSRKQVIEDVWFGWLDRCRVVSGNDGIRTNPPRQPNPLPPAWTKNPRQIPPEQLPPTPNTPTHISVIQEKSVKTCHSYQRSILMVG